jgi:CHAT domain-containing protein/tetratricopeptide (TPR) repeat protein
LHDVRLEDKSEKDIAQIRAAISKGSLEPIAALSILHDRGSGHLVQYEQSNDVDDLDSGITYYQAAVDLCREHGLPLLRSLEVLITALSSRFIRSQRRADLEEMVTKQEELLELVPYEHPNRFKQTFNLAIFFRQRAALHDISENMEKAILTYRAALSQCPTADVFRSTILGHLGSALISSFEASNDVTHLQEGSKLLTEANDLDKVDSPSRRQRQYSNARALRTLFSLVGRRDFIDAAVSELQNLVSRLSTEDPLYGTSLEQLVVSLTDRRKSTNDQLDIRNCIAVLHRELSRISDEHSSRMFLCSRMGGMLETLYELEGSMEDLNGAISFEREAICLAGSSPHLVSSLLTNLASSLKLRFERSGEMKDIEEAIQMNEKAIELAQDGDANLTNYLNNLGSTMWAKYNKIGGDSTLDNIINIFQNAILACPSTHPNYANANINLANGLQIRYFRTADIKDLEEAIKILRRMSASVDPEGPEAWFLSSSLADSLLSRFQHKSSLEDLEEAILIQRDCLNRLQKTHHIRSKCLINLSDSLEKRYNQFREMRDLLEAISLALEAIELRPLGQPDRWSALNRLAVFLVIQFTTTKNRNHLEQAIGLHREAVYLQPALHPSRADSLRQLATALGLRAVHYQDSRDLEESISFLLESLALRPSPDPYRSHSLNAIGAALMTRYNARKEMQDLDEAIRYYREATLCCPPGHPDRAAVLACLALCHELRFKAATSAEVSELALAEMQKYAKAAAEDLAAPVSQRYEISALWALKKYMPASFRLEMHVNSLALLQRLLAVSYDVDQQELKLANTPYAKGLSSEAAALAITEGQTELAVSLLDHGRSLVLSALQRYKNPLDDLRKIDPNLADDLKTIGSQLELSDGGDNSLNLDGQTVPTPFLRRSNLLKRWDELLVKVHSIPGFQHFLSMLPYQELRAAANSGPVVVLNASKRRCDAIVITTAGPPIVVPLAAVSVSSLLELSERAKEARTRSDRKGRELLLQVLRSIWGDVVFPVVKKLTALGVKRHSRIWWCCCSSFSTLPIHAAGLHSGQPKSDILDLYVSSYTPTLSDLRRVILAHDNNSPENRRILFVGHRGSNFRDSLEVLEGVVEELHALQLVDRIETETLLETEATPDAAIEKLGQHRWVHFSCHGVVSPSQPSESYFHLEGGQLRVKDLIEARIPNAEFAFLSACHTAGSGELLPDENIHLAAALQFSGFKSVIGTMWEMYDTEGPIVTKLFYEKVIELGGKYSDAAAALRFALRVMRKGGIPVERWAMFIHMGA